MLRLLGKLPSKRLYGIISRSFCSFSLEVNKFGGAARKCKGCEALKGKVSDLEGKLREVKLAQTKRRLAMRRLLYMLTTVGMFGVLQGVIYILFVKPELDKQKNS